MTTDDANEQIAALQAQVARLSVVQQQLIDTRNRLDREFERFEAMHAYNTAAVATRDFDDFASLTVESACEIFDVEWSALWLTDPDGTPRAAAAALNGIDPSELSREVVASLLDTSVFARRRAITVTADHPTLSGTVLRDVSLAACVGPGRDTYGLLLVGTTTERGVFHQQLSANELKTFTLYALQVGAILQNRADRALIERQVEQLQVDQQRLTLALEGGNAGLWDWDLITDAVFFSPRWKALIGYRPEELADSYDAWRERIHPDDVLATDERVRAYLAEETPEFENMHRLRHKDGHYVWILSTGRVMRNDAGMAVRMVGIHLDITEQRLARERAEDANRAKTEFLATMSHEIRTPMNGVLGMLQLLRDRPLVEPERQYVDMAQRSAASLMSIINDILDLSKIEAGRLELEHRPFDPASELSEAAELLRETAEAKKLRLTVDVDPDLPPLLVGDSHRLAQVVTNLVSNAIKFTDTGEIRLVVGGEPVGDNEFALAFAVRDTGIGIAPDAQVRLFAPFTQADSTTTRLYGGTGLGLAICRRLVEEMHGRISVHSAAGAGATFQVRVTLPIQSPNSVFPGGAHDVGAHHRPSLLPGSRIAGRRVLVVEDNPINQKVAQFMLDGLGVTTTVAENGAAGVAAFADGDYDLVLMDLQMPVQDGFDATRAIRALEAAEGRPRTPVIALTATVLGADRDACTEAGMDGFLSKPFNKSQLVELLDEWLPSAAAGR